MARRKREEIGVRGDDLGSYEVIDFSRLPSDYTQKWLYGHGPFWMSLHEKNGDFERWGGVWIETKVHILIDIDPVKKYAYVNTSHTPQKLALARRFIMEYGGRLYKDGAEIEINICQECGKVLNKREIHKCRKCGNIVCDKHALSYVDGNNIAITKHSPEYCKTCCGGYSCRGDGK